MPAHPKPSARKSLKLKPTDEPVAADQATVDAQAHAADAAKPPPAHKPKALKASAKGDNVRVKPARKPKGHGAVTEQERKSIRARKAPEGGGQTKGAMIQAMLRTAGGATSKEMEQATNWQPHSVRGYLGTLRKAGVNVVSKKLKGEPTIYRIEAGARPADAGEVL